MRRCVSVGSQAFVVTPHHTAVNPATIQDCRVEGWTGAAAVEFNLRGPLTLLDNQFTSSTAEPSSANVSAQAVGAAPVAVGNRPWPQTNQVVMAAGNTVDGDAMAASGLLGGVVPPNVFPYDLADTHVAAGQTAGLTSTTRFLKPWWPGIPTALVEAAVHGCSGEATDDASVCAQATIDAAAAKGNGAAAYFAPGTYSINATLVVKSGNYSVMGAGFTTNFVWAGHTSATPAVMVVQGGGGGLRLEHFAVISGGKDLAFDTKLLHIGTPADTAAARSKAARTTTYDEIYTATPGSQLWNATGFEVRDLKAGDTVHFVHLDGNLKVHDSAAGTVFLNFMIQV